MTMLATAHEEMIQSAKGLKIFVRSWLPASAPRSVVVVCHGFNSHSGQYLWVGEQLAAAGYAAFALDLRGRGRSEGERFYVDGSRQGAANGRHPRLAQRACQSRITGVGKQALWS